VESLFASSMWVIVEIPGIPKSFEPTYVDFILASRSLFARDPSSEFKEQKEGYMSEGDIVVHLPARSPCGALLSPLDSRVQHALILQHQLGTPWPVQLGSKKCCKNAVPRYISCSYRVTTNHRGLTCLLPFCHLHDAIVRNQVHAADILMDLLSLGQTSQRLTAF